MEVTDRESIEKMAELRSIIQEKCMLLFFYSSCINSFTVEDFVEKKDPQKIF